MNSANDCRRPEPGQIKIHEGIYVIQNMLKTPGGMTSGTAVNEDGVLKGVYICGDFFFYPAADLSALEDALTDVAADEASITKDVWLTGCSTIIERFELCPQAASALW
jgi:hypothetical protein